VIWLDVAAQEQIEVEAARRRIFETGGPLFGFDGMNRDAVVVAALGPGPAAKHRPRSLVPDPHATQAAIDLVHTRGEGRYRYLGSWHSHPLGRPVPSALDSDTAREMAAQDDLRLSSPLILIQATRPGLRLVRMGGMGVYRWDQAREALVSEEITIVIETERSYPRLDLD
jgi:integrative and conjugative element protein (TIGR02256 family)